MTGDEARSAVADLIGVLSRLRNPPPKGTYEVPATPEVQRFLLLFCPVVPTRRRDLLGRRSWRL